MSAGPVSTVEREVKAGGHVLLWLIVAVVAFIVLAPKAGEWFSHQAADAGVNTAKGIAKGSLESAQGVCATPGQRNYTCALPANGNRMSTPPSTTIPVPKPYGPANGPVRPLPSVTPTPTIPPAKPDLPTLEGGGEGGGLLGELPVVGGAIQSGLQALGPGLKALNP